jgi:hypothetical protein
MMDELTAADIELMLKRLTPDEMDVVHQLLATAPIWLPMAGPQLMAYLSDADVVGYGGAAGGGKTDLLLGLALTIHKRVLIVRREKAQTDGIVQRAEEILGHKDGYNSQKSTWKLDGGRLLEFGGLDNLGDEKRWQGRAHDLKALDEATEIRELQARFIMGWTRTSDPTIKPKVLMTFNPPTTAEGRWVIDYFAPWIKKGHPNPALPGELRWFAMVGTAETEMPDSRPFVIDDDGKPQYDYNPLMYRPEAIITPKSRTFIPARVTDNKYYMATGYMSILQSLPEPLRSQMLNGDFGAGVADDQWQIIPTAWVEAAQARWRPQHEMRAAMPMQHMPMDSMGVDVARGGKDQTVIAMRHGFWYDTLQCTDGTDTPNGPVVAGMVVTAKRDHAPIHIDVIGVGASPYDQLVQARQQVIGVNVASKATELDRTGQLRFFNLRSQLWWQMRESLDPAYNSMVALPPDPKLLSDLTAPRWSLSGGAVKAESKDDTKSRIGRSPDRADAVILARIETPKMPQNNQWSNSQAPYDPYANQ